MFSVAQIRGIQTALAPLAALPFQQAARNAPLQAALQEAIARPDDPLEALKLTEVRGHPSGAMRGTVFRYRSDPIHLSHLILPDNREPFPALHLEFGPKEIQPTLMGLHYVHMKRRKANVTSYLLAGGLTAFDDAGFEYSRLKRKGPAVDQMARHIYSLNLPVEGLPFKPGTKLATLDVLKRLKIRFVGDLVRQNPAELEAELGKMRWVMVRSILSNMNLLPGVPVPKWRPPPR